MPWPREVPLWPAPERYLFVWGWPKGPLWVKDVSFVMGIGSNVSEESLFETGSHWVLGLKAQATMPSREQILRGTFSPTLIMSEVQIFPSYSFWHIWLASTSSSWSSASQDFLNMLTRSFLTPLSLPVSPLLIPFNTWISGTHLRSSSWRQGLAHQFPLALFDGRQSAHLICRQKHDLEFLREKWWCFFSGTLTSTKSLPSCLSKTSRMPAPSPSYSITIQLAFLFLRVLTQQPEWSHPNTLCHLLLCLNSLEASIPSSVLAGLLMPGKHWLLICSLLQPRPRPHPHLVPGASTLGCLHWWDQQDLTHFSLPPCCLLQDFTWKTSYWWPCVTPPSILLQHIYLHLFYTIISQWTH